MKEKYKYNQRVIDNAKSSFNPLVLYNKCRDGTRIHQSQQKTGWKNSRKMQGAISICHDSHKNKAQIYPFEKHTCRNMRISKQMKYVHLLDIEFSLIPGLQ